MKRYYLVSTEHLENGLWFRDEEDFRVAMNYVAIQAARHPEVVVLAFILMSNHVHFVLRGRKEDVTEFINQFKRRYSLYLNHKYGTGEFLRRNGLDIKEISLVDEALERAIAYVQMNCVAANICAHPSQYLWGTGSSFFVTSRQTGRIVGGMTGRERQRFLHTHRDDIPSDWLAGESGYILPQSYVDINTVEKCFRTPKRMNYFLYSSSKARKRLESNLHLPAFNDQTILAAIPDLCRSLFQKVSVFELQVPELSELARQVRYRFSADVNQIARVCGVSYSEAARLLDGAPDY